MALLARGDNRAAADFLAGVLQNHPMDAELWRLQAQAWDRSGDTARAHRASAEQFALLGGLPAAIEQLQLALKAGTLDFYTGSQVDSRLRELRAEYLQQRQDRGEMR
jgi:predicted Zn-dependent protease